MKSILVVGSGSPAATQDLTLLATLKQELGITDTAQDALLTTYIDHASAIVAAITGRSYGLEPVTETFYFESGERIGTLKLGRRPVTEITSLLENDVELVADTDYALDADKGLLYRLNGSVWTYSSQPTVIVQYRAGYDLPGALPLAIERGTLMLAKSYYYGNARDTSVRSESTEGLDSISYFDALGAEKMVREMFLGPYTELVVA